MAQWVSAELPLFMCIREKLLNDPLIKSKFGDRVFDNVQKVIDYPYFIIGESEITDVETSPTLYEEIVYTFHAYSNFPNSYEVRQMIQLLYIVLSSEIELDHYDIIWRKRTLSQVFPDINKDVKHGVLKMKYKIRHKIRKE
ncbi:DUF3168 domain-containing protein [Staphylococcus shinii]|uniref:DUF3168 domain-containing protein n=1 Tax=Staphylococcus shinii TaxID=2912228 RepID=UPI000C334C7B|nr:DUF3168 domain-containing protein [Staphylococcus shinii]PKI09348.1 DUF3168 domain-containing protein [Staphylococcus shinii]